jgi:hypothetical protein
MNWVEFRKYLESKYRNRNTINTYFNDATKNISLIEDPSKILSLPISRKANIVKSLIALSKFIGIYSEFNKALTDHGFHWDKPDALDVFNGIINGNHEDLKQWYRESIKVLPDQYKTFLEFTLRTGLRRSESFLAFSMVQELSKSNQLDQYYNSKTQILEHFRFSKLFCRRTKNAYVSVVSREMIERIIRSRKVYYTTLRKNLEKNRLTLRIKGLRSLNNTFLRDKRILSENIDLVSGRIPQTVFIRNYRKVNLEDLASEILPIQDQLIVSVS